MQREKKGIMTNSQIKDSSSKIIFDEPILCAQFIRDYVDLPHMKEIQPEDIEDVSPQFVPLFAEERNADRVKRVNIRGENPFFLVSLIEHKTRVEYNVCMQILRYMVYIWEAYEKEAEREQPGVTRQKDFKYPPILPIVYYEGTQHWPPIHELRCRINHAEEFGRYIPDFRYHLVPICEYSNEDLLEKADEISLIMLLNKLQTEQDVAEFRKISPTQLEEILKETPNHLLEKIANVMLAFLLKVKVPVPEAEELVGKVREKKMAELFENMDKIDVQEMRRKTEEQRLLMEEQKRLTEEQKKRTEAQKKLTEEQKKRAEKAEELLENAIGLFIENCQEFALTKEETLSRLSQKFELQEGLAENILMKYWKE